MSDEKLRQFDGLYISTDQHDRKVLFCLFAENQYQCAWAFSVEYSKAVRAMLDTAIREIESQRSAVARDPDA